MGKRWDYDVPQAEVWREVLRVLKPGGHLLAFAGTRTQHRMAVAIEDAGFEIRDMIVWVYGSGFPKSLDVSKAIDKAAGAEREVLGVIPDRWTGKGNALNFSTDRPQSEVLVTGAPATPEAQQWQGWGTALKPALEPITVARKPLAGTVAQNVLQHGTGGLNVDGCRVGTEQQVNGPGSPTSASRKSRVAAGYRHDAGLGPGSDGGAVTGRWPANLIHDGGDEVVGLFPLTVSGKPSGKRGFSNHNVAYADAAAGSDLTGYGDSGSAARFFYCAKASKADRGEGNTHPTVKPTDLMRYLCRLVTPPGGVVLDPFMGSGSTGKAALLEGFQFIGIEREPEYLSIAKSRIVPRGVVQDQLPLAV